MSTVKTNNLQHNSAASANVVLAADGTVASSPTQNTQTGTTYTFVLADAGKIVTASNGSAQTYTVPLQASVAWGAGAKLDVLNIGAGTVTIAAAAGVTISGTPLTLATSKGGSLIRTASDAWTFIPLSSGVSNANFTDTATGTYTDGDSVDWKYITFTSSGTVTFDQAGYMKVLVVGGGQNAQSGYLNAWPDARAGGAAGRVVDGEYKVTATAYTVTVGAAASKPSYGGTSSIGTLVVAGGGIGTNAYAAGGPSNYGVESAITGTNLEYGYQNNSPNITGSGYGVASQLNQLTGATQGIVVIAVRT